MMSDKQKREQQQRYFSQRTSEIAAHWKAKEIDWREVATLILEWEKSQSPSLETSPNGMNKWLKSLALKLGLQVSNLWRYRKAAKSAIQLWGEKHGIKSPALIPKHMRPESIELVEKISRAAPSEVVDDVITRLYNKEITRSELRRIWQNIRHVVKVEERTIPIYKELPIEDKSRRNTLFEELCFESLRKDLLESEDPVLGGNGKCYQEDINRESMVDIVAVTTGPDGAALYHGVKTGPSIDEKKPLDQLQITSNIFDYLWFVLPDSFIMTNSILETVGILQYTNGKLKVVRNAARNLNPDLQMITRRIVPLLLK